MCMQDIGLGSRRAKKKLTHRGWRALQMLQISIARGASGGVGRDSIGRQVVGVYSDPSVVPKRVWHIRTHRGEVALNQEA